MKQIFFASTLMWGAEPEQIFRTAARYGAGGLELWAQQAAAFGWRTTDLARLADTFHVRLIVHAKSWDLNFAALNTGIRRASLQELKKSIFFANALGAEEITVHPPRFTLPALKNQAILAGREGLEELLECSEQLQVPLSLEVMEKLPKELVTSVDEYLHFAGPLLPRLCSTLDMAHCTSVEEFWNYAARLPKISKLHISNKQGRKLHTPLPCGDFNFAEQLPHLRKLKVPMVIEGFDVGPRFETIQSDLALCRAQEEKDA